MTTVSASLSVVSSVGASALRVGEQNLCKNDTSCSHTVSFARQQGGNALRNIVEKSCSFSTSCQSHGSRKPVVCQASGDPQPISKSPELKSRSLLCSACEGNGAVTCRQCEGGGINKVDHFQGRFKAGTTCWLCRGKKSTLCGDCNGAGFVGGFLSTQDE